MYQAGTLSGNPLAVAAGLATLRELESTSAWDALEDKGAFLEEGLAHVFRSLGVARGRAAPGLDALRLLRAKPCTTLAEVMATDRARFKRFFHAMLERGVLLPPSPFECWFLSTAHDAESLDLVLEAARASLQSST